VAVTDLARVALHDRKLVIGRSPFPEDNQTEGDKKLLSKVKQLFRHIYDLWIQGARLQAQSLSQDVRQNHEHG
jgi:hypothetical protein